MSEPGAVATGSKAQAKGLGSFNQNTRKLVEPAGVFHLNTTIG